MARVKRDRVRARMCAGISNTSILLWVFSRGRSGIPTAGRRPSGPGSTTTSLDPAISGRQREGGSAGRGGDSQYSRLWLVEPWQFSGVDSEPWAARVNACAFTLTSSVRANKR